MMQLPFWFGELFVLGHTIPRSNWEAHGFCKSNFGFRTQNVVSNAPAQRSCDPSWLTLPPVGCAAEWVPSGCSRSEI